VSIESVGNNILDGINMIKKEHPMLKLDITEASTSKPLHHIGAGTILHKLVGENIKPLTKIKAFDQFIHHNIRQSIDTAFLKLCYVDPRILS
jgi:hypothetical protein